MPCKLPVTTLQEFCLRSLGNIIKQLCTDKKVFLYDLPAAVTYLKSLPGRLQTAAYNDFLNNYKKEIKAEKLNEKHLFMCIYLRTEELFMNEFDRTLVYVNTFVGSHLKKISFSGCTFPFSDPEWEDHGRYVIYKPLYTFMKSLRNLTTFHGFKMCNDVMLQILAEHCPSLEEVLVEFSYTVSDEGVCALCGFQSAAEAESVLRTGVRVRRGASCKNLKRVTLDFTMASNLSVAVLLQWCDKLEFLNVTPEIHIGEVFTLLYGYDSSTYDSVVKKYSLKILKSTLELEDEVFSLIAQTCPNLQDITLRCYGMERKDKNLIANLLNLPITKLNLMNCNTEVLLWYLNKKGALLTHLGIENLIVAPQTVFLNRSHVQRLIMACPQLVKFSLRMCGNVSISANVPYSVFGNDLAYFTSLQFLSIEGVNLQPEDLRIFVSRCDHLEEVRLMCQSLEILEDALLYDILSGGGFKNLKTLYVFRPFLTMAGLRRILAECPYLQTVGPLSSWAIPMKDTRSLLKEIKDNNWDLNIETPETNMYLQ